MIIDCKNLRENIVNDLKLNDYKNCVAIFIQVGKDPASNVYVRNKIKLCEELGIEVRHVHINMESELSERDLIELIECFNVNNKVSGIMVQLPLPNHINELNIINAIDPKKDIDGFTNINKGKLMIGDETGLVSCTPKAILTIIESLDMELKGKNVTIVGRSNIVGKPLAQLLINKGATVTVCNSKTDKDTLINNIVSSDIFVSAIGQANYFNKEFFRSATVTFSEGSLNYFLSTIVAIDVGINRDSENKLCGDISKELYGNFKAITPVPGGVGLITVLEVVRNLIKCYELQGEN